MRILIISKRPTHPTDSGSRRFILNQVELFKRMGHDVHYLYIHEEWHPSKWGNKDCINQTQSFWGDKFHLRHVTILTILWYYALIGLRVLIRKGNQKADDTYPLFLSNEVNRLDAHYHFDCCIVNYYDLSKVLAKIKIPLKALTTHDYYSYKCLLMGKRYVKSSTDANEEAKAMQRCPNIFALNTEEAIFFSKLSPNSKIYNVFSIFEYKRSPIVGNKVLLFLSGSNDYNIKAIYWFLDEIMPEIIKKHPDAKIKIGGSICKTIKDFEHNPNVELVGLVDDADAFYNSADIFINPTFIGSGLKIKTFESIAYDKVTMAHPHSAVGIFKPESAPIFLSSVAREWADYLDLIWGNPGYIEVIKRRNEKYMKEMMAFVESEYHRFFSLLTIRQ